MTEQEQQRTRTNAQQTFPDLPEVNLDKVADYTAYDVQGSRIGKVTAIWTDESGQPAFLGIRTTWLLGKTHIVPAYGASVNHQEEMIQLPYTEEDVKNAPSYDPEATLDDNTERQVCEYYRSRGGQIPDREVPDRREEASTTQSRTSPQSEARVQLHEEQVRAGKREVEAGGVRLRKIVRTETVQTPVEVQREDVVIEHVPANESSPSPEAFKNKEYFIPLRREEPAVEKQTRVTGEVRARKTTNTERKNVASDVRKEDVEIQDERQRKAA